MRFRERLLAILLVLSTACAVSTLGRAQDFPMGTNLTGVSYGGNNWPFRDAFKCSSSWLNTDWREAAPGEFAVDARGWITSLRAGQVARTIIFGGEGVRYPAGRYTVLYDGEGTLEYSSNVRVVESSPGRQVVEVDNAPAEQEIQGGGVALSITSIVASNPTRNIRFMLPGPTTNFTWSAGTGVYEYWLSVYSPAEATQANEIHSRTSGIALSATVSGLPTNGTRVLVRLSYRTSTGWRSVDNHFTGGLSEEERRQEARRAEIERLRSEAARRRAEAAELDVRRAALGAPR